MQRDGRRGKPTPTVNDDLLLNNTLLPSTCSPLTEKVKLKPPPITHHHHDYRIQRKPRVGGCRWRGTDAAGASRQKLSRRSKNFEG